jgi:glutamine amidotransferase
VTGNAAGIGNADRLILPGVGAFGDAMATLRDRGLVEPIRRAVACGIPFLGICLGMQLLADRSDEFGVHEGLGIIPGHIHRLPEGPETRIPNVGWRPLTIHGHDSFLGALPTATMVYFVHSFGFAPTNPANIAATISINGQAIAAVLRHENVIGYQFHPEKSGPAGLDLIDRFLRLT